MTLPYEVMPVGAGQESEPDAWPHQIETNQHSPQSNRINLMESYETQSIATNGHQAPWKRTRVVNCTNI